MKLRHRLHFLPALLAAGTVRANDDFAQRVVLPAQETVEMDISVSAAPGYEFMDPLAFAYHPWGADPLAGSLWYEWTAPRDGNFKVSVTRPGGLTAHAYVLEGTALEQLLFVKNGSLDGITGDGSTAFAARAGARYQIGVRTTADAPGHLRLAPAPPEPENTTLARRHVLSGPLPLTVTATNFASGTREMGFLSGMTELGSNRPFWASDWGPALWWEWTCPADGNYELRPAPGAYGCPIFAGARQDKAFPGQWLSPISAGAPYTIRAGAGDVFDIAFATLGRDSGVTNQYGEISFTLRTWTAPPVPTNLLPENALPLPAGLPLRYPISWTGGTIPTDWWGFARLFFQFEAPADGYYRLGAEGDFWNFDAGPMQYNYRVNRVWLRTGERLPVSLNFSPWSGINAVLTAAAQRGTEGADHRAEATALGSARDFTLLAHRAGLTIEPGEPVLPGAPPTGTAWWTWTAPADGWLTWQGDEETSAYLEVMEGTKLTDFTREVFQNHGHSVEAGHTYFLRATMLQPVAYSVCCMTLGFDPLPPNSTPETATDLGTTELPSWTYPRGPYNDQASAVWLRWTAAATVRAGLPAADWRVLHIYTDPIAGERLPQDSDSDTWQFTAGRTYWLHTYGGSRERIRLVPAPHTTHGSPRTPLVLESKLPAGGFITLRGDTNTPKERLLLDGLLDAWEMDPGYVPVVWYRWQAPATQIIHAGTAISPGGYAPRGLFVFSSDSPEKPVTREPLEGNEPAGGFLSVRAGRTYWFACAGDHGTGLREFNPASLALHPVVESRPANDDFARRTPVDPHAWQDWTPLFGTHRQMDDFHPLRHLRSRATLEIGEPPVVTIIGAEGDAIPQTATTWWTWTAPASGIYGLHLEPPSAVFDRAARGSGPDVPEELFDLTANLYTGDSLETLRPVPAYEQFTGRYLFRATAGVTYTFRVASGAALEGYVLHCNIPDMLDCFDFAALERLDFEEVGNGWASYAGDGIPNWKKLYFGMDYYLRADHPANVAAARGRLPRQTIAPGWLELRCRPETTLAPAGSLENLRYSGALYGFTSSTLTGEGEVIYPSAAADGELALRVPIDDQPRRFLRWDPLADE